MAAWIGGTEASRFWGYIVPAARKAVNDGGWLERAMLDYVAQGEAHKAILETAEEGSLVARQAKRRLETCRRDWRSLRDMRKRDLATLAEADRRKAYRKEVA